MIDTSSHEIVKRVIIGDYPGAISITPNGRFAYVPATPNRAGLDRSRNISVIEPSSNTVVKTVVMLDRIQPVEVVITPNGKYGYVLGWNNSTISLIDLSENRVIKTIDTGLGKQWGAATAVGTPDSRFVYVVFWESDALLVIDTASHEAIQTIAAKGLISIAPDGRLAYVGDYRGNTVSVIDTSSHQVLQTIAVGKWPAGIAITPDGGLAYVANRRSDTVSIIDTSSHKVIETIAVGRGTVLDIDSR